MLKPIGPQLAALTASSPNSPSSINRRQEQADRASYAAERTRLLFGCYRKADADDPDTFAAAIAAVLADYPQEVMRTVTDPRTGIPSRVKWLPNAAEVHEACEHEMVPIRQREDRETRDREYRRSLPPPLAHQARKTLDELYKAFPGIKPPQRTGIVAAPEDLELSPEQRKAKYAAQLTARPEDAA